MAAAATPNVLWAERSDRVFVTIEVTDAQSPKVDIGADGRLTFAGYNGEGKLYELDLQLAGPVSSSESKVAVTPRHVLLVLQKSSPGPHWGRLLKAAGKAPHNVKVDWTKYVDEEEEAAEASKGPGGPGDDFGGFDLSQLESMKNFGGSDNFGEEEEDSDDDGPPGLEDKPWEGPPKN